jgi:hypothetical protein
MTVSGDMDVNFVSENLVLEDYVLSCIAYILNVFKNNNSKF